MGMVVKNEDERRTSSLVAGRNHSAVLSSSFFQGDLQVVEKNEVTEHFDYTQCSTCRNEQGLRFY